MAYHGPVEDGFDSGDGLADVVEEIADWYGWDTKRLDDDDQIVVAIKGQWRTYSITLAWNASDETLRLVCTYEVEPPPEKLPALYEMLNLVNDQCWGGFFTYWGKQQLMVWRYGLILNGCEQATVEQVETCIGAALYNCERFYPCFTLALWGDETPKEAIRVAMTEAYGTA